MIIAIDGPSGAGKSTLGKMLAEKLGLLYLDTGAMYRAVALAVLEEGADLNDKRRVTEIARASVIDLAGGGKRQVVKLSGRNVTDEIRNPGVGQAASIVSTYSEVREYLVDRQRFLGGSSAGGAVLDGRDIGTVVFPDADVKFFLTATPEARAKRRFEEDRSKGRETGYEETLLEINARDRRDADREDSPLTVARDAFVIDSSGKSLDEVLAVMVERVKSSRGGSPGLDHFDIDH